MLQNKNIIITGASRGIGKAISKKFAQNGANLFLIASKKSNLSDLRQELIEAYGVNVEVYNFDISDYESVKNFFKDFTNINKTLDVLVNNAGILYDGLLPMLQKEKIEEMYAVNTFAPIYMSQFASRIMIRNKKGSIINITSIMGTNGDIGQIGYSGSKSALIGITKSMSKELAGSNIRVNAIAPGFIETDMTSGLTECKMDERLRSIKMKRAGKPEEVADVTLFLASDLSSYVTGQVIGVDGGMLV